MLFLENKKGIKFEMLMDTEDLDKLKILGFHWYVKTTESNTENTARYYAITTKYLGYVDGKPKYESIRLHRFLTNAEKGEVVDHINHNTLDNRKENLRNIFDLQNTKNRKTKNQNNTSGYRNVSLIQNQWVIQMQVDGKNTRLKSYPYNKLDEAGLYAAEMRTKYYGEFAGNN